ncbi:unnamed protein product [Candidula unifasciata]|uniref:Uncharacterized protein n=1 Tax=Candidula unifasciata TaxID=100452 RepID=A0A8S3ZL49_9EUPU|nr:unnamed protein product [Candidula unifasciata]
MVYRRPPNVRDASPILRTTSIVHRFEDNYFRKRDGRRESKPLLSVYDASRVLKTVKPGFQYNWETGKPELVAKP